MAEPVEASSLYSGAPAHGGLAIYLSSKYKFKSINMYENSDIWEGQFIEVNEIANKLICYNW